ncbi:hypothetical protein AB1Y20_007929 [Prymnesium parvum]|uniref:Uncharacterized protein n=1 Tax=Prymnesium parvum TaxID=97485 RepID=A0AB34IV72_PRYPA
MTMRAFSVQETHGKLHALRREINEVRAELARSQTQLHSVIVRINALEKELEQDQAVCDVHTKASPRSPATPVRMLGDSDWSGVPMSPRSASLRVRRVQERILHMKEQQILIKKRISRKESELSMLLSRLETIESIPQQVAALLPRQDSLATAVGPRALENQQLESELRFLSRQRRAKLMTPAARARLKKERQVLLLEEFDDQLPYRRDIERMLELRKSRSSQDPLDALTERLERLQRSQFISLPPSAAAPSRRGSCINNSTEFAGLRRASLSRPFTR